MNDKIFKIMSWLLVFLMVINSLAYALTAEENTVRLNDLNKHAYRLITELCSIDEAKIYCDNMGGHLLEVEDAQEEEFVEGILRNQEIDKIMIGAIAKEGSFKWLSTGKNVEYNKLDPMNTGVLQENSLCYLDKTDGLWHVENDNEIKMAFICEWDNDYIDIKAAEDNISIEEGMTKKLQVMAYLRDGRNIDITSNMKFAVQSEDIAEIYVDKLKALKAGETNITGSYEGREIIIKIRVTKKVVVTSNPIKTPIPTKYPTPIKPPAKIFTPSAAYTYDRLEKDLKSMQKAFKNRFELMVIGKSVLGKNIYCIKIGNGNNKVIYTGATHAREEMGTLLIMEYAERLIRNQISQDINPEELLKKSTIYMIPMINPDGVDIVYKGVGMDNPYYSKLLKLNKGNRDFSQWKANGRGININRNFSYRFKLNYESGSKPESEPETYAIANLIRSVKPDVIINYHSVGNVIFSIGKSKYPEINKYGTKLSKLSGYGFEYPAVDWGGCTDYAIASSNGKIKAYTIEVGYKVVPVPLNQYNSILKRCLKIFKYTSTTNK